ncbi:MAG: Glutathione S-transferase GstB [SAR116 cluster bacterium MED-G04]|nr:MAG: Glutathione S-transferase GstB [SAR116 cluster bacterium MED-G04]
MRVLHHYWLSSGSRFCRLMLAEKKLDALQKLEHWWERDDGFLALNPAGTVPVVVEDDGTVLAGVWSIAEYFEDTMPETSLLPGTPAQRAEARRLVDWFQGKVEREVVTPLVREKFFRRVTGDGVPSSTVIRTALSNLQAHLEYINYLAERRKWLAGSKMSLADLHAAASLSVVDFMGDIHWEDYPEAKSWYSRVKSRPSFRSLLADTVTGLTPPKHYTNLDF